MPFGIAGGPIDVDGEDAQLTSSSSTEGES